MFSNDNQMGRTLSRLGGIRQGGGALVKATLLIAAVGMASALTLRVLQAQEPPEEDPEPPLVSLKSIEVPGPSAEVLAQFIDDKTVAIQLGKALFWERRVSSDNRIACASCHYHAGADNRIVNQISPGLLGGDTTFQLPGPNTKLTQADFPLTKHASVDSGSEIISDVNEVIGSQGVFSSSFTSNRLGDSPDRCAGVSDDVFHGGSGFNINGINTRRVTGRNAPSVINAVFNFRNFWDGRANNMFNGGDPFGMRNPNALVWRVDADGVTRKISIAIPSSALASQTVGPPLSAFEMSCSSRAWANVGKKLLDRVPLTNQPSRQAIAVDDSVLAPLLLGDARATYADLVRKAFRPEYWTSDASIDLSATDEEVGSMDLPAPGVYEEEGTTSETGPTSQMEANFALFLALSIQLYESTLIADDTPFDRYLEGDTTAMSARQIRGFKIFTGQGKCSNCHSGAELTNASFANVTNQRLERMLMSNGQEAVYDNGFYNVGVRPPAEDLGVGGTDPFGNPLSETRMAQQGKTSLLGNSFDPAKEPTVGPDDRVAVNGAFKTPGLRNVEFTAPYFHNGGKATLMQVVDFYNRGGDFSSENQDDLDPDITPLGLTEYQKRDLVSFMLALSDDRVRYRRAPFDHPAICITLGHKVDSYGVLVEKGTTDTAVDRFKCLKAVGANGATSRLPRFLGLSPYQH